MVKSLDMCKSFLIFVHIKGTRLTKSIKQLRNKLKDIEMKKDKTIKKWTKEKIAEFLDFDPNANYRALVLIYNLQTKDEQELGHVKVINKVGFTGIDCKILSSFAQQYIEKKYLSPKQFEILKKKMKKYCKQLTAIANKEL